MEQDLPQLHAAHQTRLRSAGPALVLVRGGRPCASASAITSPAVTRIADHGQAERAGR